MAERQLSRLPVRHHGGALGKVVPSDGQLTEFDIDAAVEGLPEEQAVAIRKTFAVGTMENHLRAQAVDVDAKELRSKLGHAVQAAVAAHQEGLSVTETTTHDHETGRTELIVGNTTTAERGKMSSGQRGTEDHTLAYAIIAAVVFIIAVALLR